MINVHRLWSTQNTVCGSLDLDGVFQCFTMEPRMDQSKGKPFCIPAGAYDLLVMPSLHFGFDTPHLLAVPGFTEIEIHPGNDTKDTHGCTLVGQTHSQDWVGQSDAAFASLMTRIQDQTVITYSNEFEQAA